MGLKDSMRQAFNALLASIGRALPVTGLLVEMSRVGVP